MRQVALVVISLVFVSGCTTQQAKVHSVSAKQRVTAKSVSPAILGSLVTLGDANCDSKVDIFDIDAFVLGITNADAYWAQYDCLGNCNTNQDWSIDLFDIDTFAMYLNNTDPVKYSYNPSHVDAKSLHGAVLPARQPVYIFSDAPTELYIISFDVELAGEPNFDGPIVWEPGHYWIETNTKVQAFTVVGD